MKQYSNDSYMGFEEQPAYMPDNEERLLAILSHILSIVPGVGILGPLIIYLLKGNRSSFVHQHARESLNFQITILLLCIVSLVLIIILIGFALIWVLGIINTILVIVAAIKASDNKLYRYPFNFRLI